MIDGSRWIIVSGEMMEAGQLADGMQNGGFPNHRPMLRHRNTPGQFGPGGWNRYHHLSVRRIGSDPVLSR
jgi:hypothetical protein